MRERDICQGRRDISTLNLAVAGSTGIGWLTPIPSLNLLSKARTISKEY